MYAKETSTGRPRFSFCAWVCVCVCKTPPNRGFSVLNESLIRRRATQATDAATDNFYENCIGGRVRLGLGGGGGLENLETNERKFIRIGDYIRPLVICGRNSWHYLKIHRQQQRFGEFDLQKVKQKLHITFFPRVYHAHVYTHASVSLRSVQAYQNRFVKAWSKPYQCVCTWSC